MAVRIIRRDGGLEAAFAGETTGQLPSTSIFADTNEAAGFFSLGATGYSATHQPGHYHGMELRTLDWTLEPLRVEEAASCFFSDRNRFPGDSVQLDCALLMKNIAHEWHSRPDLYLSKDKRFLAALT